MNADLSKRLERLRLFSTRYEIELRHTDGRAYLVLYTARRTFAGMIGAVRERWDDVAALTGVDSWDAGGKRNATEGRVTSGEWSIRFSGRTQRECYITGELPFVGDVAKAIIDGLSAAIGGAQ